METEYVNRITHLQRQLHTTHLALKHYMMNQNGGNGSNFNSLDSKDDHVSINISFLLNTNFYVENPILLAHMQTFFLSAGEEGKFVNCVVLQFVLN